MTLAQVGIKYDILYNMKKDEIKIFNWPLIGEIHIKKLTDFSYEDIDNGYEAWFPQLFNKEIYSLYQWKYGTKYFLYNLKIRINQLLKFYKFKQSFIILSNGFVYSNKYYEYIDDILNDL